MLQLLNMPDQHSARVQWLEQQLLSDQLGNLVDELSLIATDSPPTQSFDSSRKKVLQQGLRVLSESELHQLLSQPSLLLELQEDILIEGGAYWDRLKQQSYSSQVQQNQQRLASALGLALPEASDMPDTIPFQPKTSGGWVAWMTSMAAAVILFMALWTFWPPTQTTTPPKATGWGWNREGALAQTTTPLEYLNQLANAAKEWFNKSPEDAKAFAQRLLQFRQGCSRLILSEHPVLKPEDAQWLKDKCQAWAAKLDAHLALIESGQFEQGREQTNETIQKLIQALETRAKQAKTT